jgi:arylsulfatase/arylsulfatase A
MTHSNTFSLKRACPQLLAIAIALLLGAAPPIGHAQDKPNVILILTDDQGYGDLGATGNPIIRTPHIDAMAKRSASINSFYVEPVCSPTRASIMTGRYHYRTRVIDTWKGRSMMDPAEYTLAEALRAGGYATGIFGKWHLGDNYPMRPHDQGFDTAIVHRGGGLGQPSDPPGGSSYFDPILFHNGQPVKTTGYCTDVYFNEAMRWLEGGAKNDPFFIYIPTNAPHSPFGEVPEAPYNHYKQLDLANRNFPQNTGHPLPNKIGKGVQNNDTTARIFSMVENIDDNVGRLFDYLDANNLTDNTLVIFMTDNGPNGRRFNGGMQGMKTEVYEGGVRTCFFAHWPARLQPGHASDHFAAHIDLMPTILDACDVTPNLPNKIDGRSVLPLLEGDPAGWPNRTVVTQVHRGDAPKRYHHFMIRDNDYKLVNNSGFNGADIQGEPNFELYDMQKDPLEQVNLAPHRTQLVAKYRRLYDAWFDDVSSTRVNNYDPPRIYLGTDHENPVDLSRQNWRINEDAAGWERKQRGAWWLKVAKTIQADILLRFDAADTEANATLFLDDESHTVAVPAGAEACVFKNIQLAPGDLLLETRIDHPKYKRAAWQVEVSW